MPTAGAIARDAQKSPEMDKTREDLTDRLICSMLDVVTLSIFQRLLWLVMRRRLVGCLLARWARQQENDNKNVVAPGIEARPGDGFG